MQETTSITPTAVDPKRRYLCRHIFTEGHRCGSPALRGQSLCYNHNRSRREAGIAGKSGTFPMPRIDDRASIQLALFEVLSRLAGGDIEFKRGGILLYGLQIASSNLPRHAKIDAEQQPQVEDVTPDYYLGDLAPITEIVAPAAQSPATRDRPDDRHKLPEPPSEREYTEEERYFLDNIISVTGRHLSEKYPRPDSITEEDIVTSINTLRHRAGLRPIDPPARNKSTARPSPNQVPSTNGQHPTAPATDRLILAAVQAVGTQPASSGMTFSLPLPSLQLEVQAFGARDIQRRLHRPTALARAKRLTIVVNDLVQSGFTASPRSVPLPG